MKFASIAGTATSPSSIAAFVGGSPSITLKRA